MNVFYLDRNVKKCAEMHCDKHTCKMIIEYAQLLSTAHRVLDGDMYLDKTANGRSIKRWRLDKNEDVLYKASHINHPSAIWARQTNKNYLWLYQVWFALCKEYEHRYGREHLTFTKLKNVIGFPPKNIAGGQFTLPPQAMPDHCKMDNPIDAYRNYYKVEKKNFAKWTNRPIPNWFLTAVA